jgi:hypothetical protein
VVRDHGRYEPSSTTSQRDPHVNLAYYDGNAEWASVSGTRRAHRSARRFRELYRRGLRLWFPDDGDDPRHGTPDDPRMVLIGVTIHAAAFLEVNKPEAGVPVRSRSRAGSPARSPTSARRTCSSSRTGPRSSEAGG